MTKRYYAGARLLATRTGTSLYFIQPDHLGSASTVTDASGQVVARERYSAFGERRRGESPATTDYLYTDQRYSASVGFYHYTSGAPGRQYDPLLGRFLQADPVTPDGSQGLNRYAYVLNNPLSLSDPSGNDPLGPQWITEFQANHNGRNPDEIDVFIRLFSIAYPNEWNESTFYNANGHHKTLDEIMDYLWIASGQGRTWATLPIALQNLARAYEWNEVDEFVRDVATLWGSTVDRLHGNVDWLAIFTTRTDLWVPVGANGLSRDLRGSDGDNNVHHWARAFALGYFTSWDVAITTNVAHERAEWYLHWRDPNRDLNYRADLELGGRGIRLGYDFRWKIRAHPEWFQAYGLGHMIAVHFEYFTFNSSYYPAGYVPPPPSGALIFPPPPPRP